MTKRRLKKTAKHLTSIKKMTDIKEKWEIFTTKKHVFLRWKNLFHYKGNLISPILTDAKWFFVKPEA